MLYEIMRRRPNDPPKENNFLEPLPLQQSSQLEYSLSVGVVSVLLVLRRE